MIAAVVALLSARWVQYALASIAAAALLWFGVINPYNNWVKDEAVAAALKDERAVTEPVFRKLTEDIRGFEEQFKQIVTLSETRRKEQQAKLNIKTIEYKNALYKAATIQSKYEALLGNNAEFTSLLDSATANNNLTAGAGAGARLKQLSEAHRSCERDLRISIEQTIATADQLSQAVAVIEALKN